MNVESPALTEARERLRAALALLESLIRLSAGDASFATAWMRARDEAINAANDYASAPKIGG